MELGAPTTTSVSPAPPPSKAVLQSNKESFLDYLWSQTGETARLFTRPRALARLRVVRGTDWAPGSGSSDNPPPPLQAGRAALTDGEPPAFPPAPSLPPQRSGAPQSATHGPEPSASLIPPQATLQKCYFSFSFLSSFFRECS